MLELSHKQTKNRCFILVLMENYAARFRVQQMLNSKISIGPTRASVISIPLSAL